MICAITLALIGHSGLDEDKCLGLGWKSFAAAGFRSISERKEMFINGMLDISGFREFNHLADLLSKRSHNLSSLQCAAYKYPRTLKLDFKMGNCEF